MRKYGNSTAMAVILALAAGTSMTFFSSTAVHAQDTCADSLQQIEQRVDRAGLSDQEKQEFDNMLRDARQLAEDGETEQCRDVVADIDRFADGDTAERGAIIIKRQQAQLTVRQAQPEVTVSQAEPKITVRQAQPEVTVRQAQPTVTVRQAQPQVTIRMPKPQIIVRQGEPIVTITQAEPEVIVEQNDPEVQVNQRKPEISIDMPDPEVTVQQSDPEVIFDRPEPRVIVQKQDPAVSVERQEAAITVEQEEPELAFEQQETRVTVEQQQAAVEVNQQEPKVNIEQQEAEVTVETQEPQISIEQEPTGDTDRPQLAAEAATQDQPESEALADADKQQIASANADAPQVLENELYYLSIEKLQGTEVFNARGEHLGDIDDIFRGDDNRLFALMGVGGFLGIGDKDVAVPIDELEMRGERVVMRGETEESLSRLPDFDSGDYTPLDSTLRPVDYVE